MNFSAQQTCGCISVFCLCSFYLSRSYSMASSNTHSTRTLLPYYVIAIIVYWYWLQLWGAQYCSWLCIVLYIATKDFYYKWTKLMTTNGSLFSEVAHNSCGYHQRKHQRVITPMRSWLETWSVQPCHCTIIKFYLHMVWTTNVTVCSSNNMI